MSAAHTLELPAYCEARGPFSELLLAPQRPGWWRLDVPFMYELPAALGYPADEIVVVPAGFECDLDSVPRLPLAYWLAKGRTVAAAVVHDWLYKSGRLYRGGPRVTRAAADRIFLAAMRDEGVAWRHRVLIYAAVRVAGWLPWRRYRCAQVHA
jgi:hypothetical protein